MNLPFCELINKVTARLDPTMLLTMLPTLLYKEGSKEGIGKEGKRGKEGRKDAQVGRSYHFFPHEAHSLFFLLANQTVTFSFCQYFMPRRPRHATSRLI